MSQKGQTIESDMTKCSTETSTKVLEIRSTIINVSKQPNETEVIGPDFYLRPNCMCCISSMKKEEDVYVYFCNKSLAEIKIERKLFLFDRNNQKLHEEIDDHAYSLKIDENKQLMRKQVNNRSSFDTLANDTLIINICVNIKEITGGEIKRFISIYEPERKLKEDLKKMLENPVNSDVSLQVGNERIPAHWSVLCSRSPYFKRMFDSNMKERIESSIGITDISFYTLKKLVEYLYTAHFDEDYDFQNLLDLYFASDKYEVRDMRTLCAVKIISNAKAENVCQILQLAHRYNDKDLKMEAIEFIRIHSDTVFQTEGWQKFEASEPLAAELIGFFCVKKN